MRLTFLLLITLSVNAAVAQNRFEDAKYIYWQKGTKLQYTDFKNKAGEPLLSTSENLKYRVQIPAILEYAETGENLQDMKYYIAPAFDREFSVFVNHNEFDLEQAQLYFDISEYWARITRERISELLKRDIYGGFNLEAFYVSDLKIKYPDTKKQFFEEKIAQKDKAAFTEVFRDIIEVMYMEREKMAMELYFEMNFENKEAVVANWRKKADDLLKFTDEFATSQAECLRFINARPANGYQVVFEDKGR